MYHHEPVSEGKMFKPPKKSVCSCCFLVEKTSQRFGFGTFVGIDPGVDSGHSAGKVCRQKGSGHRRPLWSVPGLCGGIVSDCVREIAIKVTK